jgi:transcriptional regulator with XRE-family HTH domain
MAAGKDAAVFKLNGGAVKLTSLLQQYMVKNGYKSAEAANTAAGLPCNTISRYMRGHAAGISILALRRLSKLLEMSPAELADTILHCGEAASTPAIEPYVVPEPAPELEVPELEVPELEVPELPESAEGQLTADQLIAEAVAAMQADGLPAVAVEPSVTVTVGNVQTVVEQLSKDAAPVIIESQGRRIVVQVA